MKTLLRYFIMTFASVMVMTLISCNMSCEAVRIDSLPEQAWDSSVWISASDAPFVTGKIGGKNQRAADGSSWFVSTLKNPQKVVSAKWMTSALGVYDIYVNGRLVGAEVLKPGFTHNSRTKYSFTYDVTALIQKGAGAENMFSAQVTPGWWGDRVSTPHGHEGMVGRKCAFRGVVELTFADGSEQYYPTGLECWKAGVAGPVKHAAIFDGEEYDARELMGYEVVDRLGVPEENVEFQGDVLPSKGAEVYRREDLVLCPVLSYVWSGVENEEDDCYGKVKVIREYKSGDAVELKAGETLVVDFGQNAAAVPSFVFKAAEGTVLTCLPSEILNDGNGAKSRGMDGPEGSCHRLNLRMSDDFMKLEYTFADSRGYVEYTPRCTFFGYRYLSITSTSDVRIKRMTSVPISSVTEQMLRGTISTGNELVNKLISNTVWGMYSNYLSVPTDCPQRNERLGWTADTQVFARTATYFADTESFINKWMRDLRDSQSSLGGFPGVAPKGQFGDPMMRVGWADAGVIVPWTMWLQYGDVDIINENWDAMDRFISHVEETGYDHQTLSEENRNYQWADWLSYEPLESCGGGIYTKDSKGGRQLLPEAVEYWNYLSKSYWLIDAMMLKDMALATGRCAERYESMIQKVKELIKAEHLDSDGLFRTQILNTMQTPALFALKNDLVEGKAKEDMIARLRQNFADHGNCLQTGFLGTSILMSTLTENGMADIAYELLFQRKNPSWLYSIDNGATTIWERWNSYMIEHGMGPKGMNSFNHYAYGCVCEWIWETVAGIASDPAAPGFKHIIMCPIPDRRLGHLTAEYQSASGVIKSSWRYEGDQWIWDFTIPEGTTASVTLPGETESAEYAAGSYTLTKLL